MLNALLTSYKIFSSNSTQDCKNIRYLPIEQVGGFLKPEAPLAPRHFCPAPILSLREVRLLTSYCNYVLRIKNP